MNRLRRFAVIVFVALPLSNCATSPKVNYFTLEPVKGHTQGAYGNEKTIQLVSVHIPASLDRREMVRQAGGETLDISDQNRWAAPLDEMIQRVLTQDLAARLEGGVIFPGEPAPNGTDEVVVDVLEFADNGSGTVVFDGSWSLIPSGTNTPEWSRQLHLTAPDTANNFRGQAAAMSQILGQLSVRIAAYVTKG